MPLRFFRRVRIAPGVTINLSKSGPSVSVGPRGAKVTLGHGRVRRTVGLPGTGLFYTSATKLGAKRPTQPPDPFAPLAAIPPAESTGPTTAAPSGARGFWSRRSFGGKVAIVVGILLAIELLGTALPSTAAPRPTAAEPSAPGSLLPFVAAPGGSAGPASSATSRSRLPTASPPMPKATPKPTPRPTPKPTPHPTPKPTAKPAASLSVTVVSLTSPVSAGQDATLAIRTAAGATCSIEVVYESGPSTAAGLGTKTASSSGNVSWTWKVGSRTSAGTWPIYVTCSKSGISRQLTTHITVT
jgi:hypothetical protein